MKQHWALKLWPTDDPLPLNSRIQADHQLHYQWCCREENSASCESDSPDQYCLHETYPPVLNVYDTLRVYFMFETKEGNTPKTKDGEPISKPHEIRLTILGDVPEEFPHRPYSSGVLSGDPPCCCWPEPKSSSTSSAIIPFFIIPPFNEPKSKRTPGHPKQEFKLFSFDVKVVVSGDQGATSFGVDPEMVVGEDSTGSG